jgi:hypothetical protein
VPGAGNPTGSPCDSEAISESFSSLAHRVLEKFQKIYENQHIFPDFAPLGLELMSYLGLISTSSKKPLKRFIFAISGRFAKATGESMQVSNLSR